MRAKTTAKATGTTRANARPGGRTSARSLVVAALALPLLACGTPETGSAQSSPEARRLAGGEDWKTDFTKHSVPLSEIVSGGPPRDGIPSIDDPKFGSPGEEGDWLESSDPVMVVEIDGQAKAYPLSILIAHEIVNDELAGRPIAVTYCPLCNTALVFDRRVERQVVEFGTTGRLRHSDLVMYDRWTHSWWQQASGEAIVGRLTGTVLDFVPSNVLSWERALELYPDLQVLSRDTGFFRRRYGTNPYAGYDRLGNRPIGNFFRAELDSRLPAMARVAGVQLGDGWAAPFSELAKTRVANAEAAGTPVVVFWAPGAASALDARRVSEGRDVGMSAAFDRRLEGRTLTFTWNGERWTDRETGSAWDMAGRAVSGPLEGRRLTPVQHANHFWFAWATFQPDTEIWEAEG